MAEKKKDKSSQRKQEILGIVIMSSAILLLLGIVSYHASDYPGSGNRETFRNWFGIAGAVLSHYLYVYTIGYACLIFPIILFLLGWRLFLQTPWRSFFRNSRVLLEFGVFFSVALAMPQAASETGSSIGYRLSGLFGGFIAEKLVQYLGTAGSVVVLFTTLLVLLMSVTSLNVRDTVLRFKEAAQSLWSAIRSTAGSSRSDEASALEPDEEDEIDDDEESDEEEDIGDGEEDAAALAGPRKPVGGPGQKSGQGSGQTPGQGPALPPPMTVVKRPAIRTNEDDRGPAVRPKPSGAEAEYQFPPLDLLSMPRPEERRIDKTALETKAHFLEDKLKEYDILGEVVEIMPGPIITRFEVRPAPGVKVNRFIGIQDDLALVLKAQRVRVAPIPGKAVVGIEVPNESPSDVALREILESRAYDQSDSKLTVALGKTVAGLPFVTDLAQMPHLLVAGATGSGKSVCLNTLITSILYRAKPSEVKFVLIDPKKLELSLYKKLQRHHLTKHEDMNEAVVTTVDNAVIVLKSLELEMDKRYRMLAHAGVRSIDDFNRAIDAGKIRTEGSAEPMLRLPYVVLVIDELADLMVLGAREVEEPIARLAQMARAVGIHLILATQRPSVDVITGVIKANFPCRIAFQVASKIDSRTILDRNGAEKLLGKGDMLFLQPRDSEPIRLHGAYISTEEVQSVVEFIASQPGDASWVLPGSGSRQAAETGGGGLRDELFNEAARLVVRHQQGSASLLQRRLRVGYSRAGRLIDELEAAGILGPFDGSKARTVLVDEEQVERILELDGADPSPEGEQE
jgi:DNA segregation ATPase FtsK/SpoIIIE, S-DNA-T family